MIVLLSCCDSKKSKNNSLTETTGFKLLSPNITNINFKNTLTETDSFNYFIYEGMYNGAGVGLLDVNNDGLLDMILISNQETDKLYLNKGGFKFEDITKSSGIKKSNEWESGVTIADINADGWDDIYISCNLSDNSAFRRNKLYINNKNNTFTESAKLFGIDDIGYSIHANFFDYDLDGDLDLFVVNQPPNNYELKNKLQHKIELKYSSKFYENINNKNFIDKSKETNLQNSSYALSATIGDISNDGWPDIYISNDYEEPDQLFINNKNKTFTNISNTSLRHMSNFSMGVDIADFNNDGWLDIYTVDMVSEDHYRNKTNMGAMNPDKFWNLVSNGYHFQYMYNSMQLNQGNGLFSEIAHMLGIAQTDWSFAALFADFDNDGNKDIFITNGMLRDVRNKDIEIKKKEIFEKMAKENIHKLAQSSLTKFLDILPSEPIRNYLYKNTGNLGFQNVTTKWNLNEKSFSQGAAYGDLDNDGDLDLVVNNLNQPAFVYENLNQGNYINIKLLGSNFNTKSIGARAVLYSNNKLQMCEMTNVRGYMSTSELSIHFGLGASNKVDSLLIRWPSGKSMKIYNPKINQNLLFKEADAKDFFESQFNQTIKKVLSVEITSELLQGIQHKENMFDDYAREILLPYKMSTLGPCLDIGDVNNDQLTDFYLGGSSNLDGQLFLQNEFGGFIKSEFGPKKLYKECEEVDALFFDMDDDKDLDLFVASGGNENSLKSNGMKQQIYKNNGTGKFSEASIQLPTLNASLGIVKNGDFDNDGDEDLFLGGRQIPGKYGISCPSFILKNDKGIFKNATKDICPIMTKDFGNVTDACWLDIDNDSDLDLLIVGEWMPLRVFINDSYKLVEKTKDFGIENSRGWWNTIAFADFDNDGDFDLVAGNAGLNTKFKTSIQNPFKVYLGDFDKNSSHDIYLSAYDIDGNYYPVRGKQCSSEQMPFINNKYKTYAEFARSNIENILDGKMENAVIKEVDEFRSVCFENKGGRFEITSLPIESQISPIHSFIIIDINSDKLYDIIYCGNYYNREVETTRSDAGIGGVLLNKGNMNFVHMPFNLTGLKLFRDAREMRVLTVKEKIILLTANNNEILQANQLFLR